MKQKIIKVSNTHYIVIDDSDIQEGDWVYHIGRHIIYKFEQKLGYKREFDALKKITHSFGKELKGVINKPLSEAEEALYGYSVEDYAWNNPRIYRW